MMLDEEKNKRKKCGNSVVRRQTIHRKHQEGHRKLMAKTSHPTPVYPASYFRCAEEHVSSARTLQEGASITATSSAFPGAVDTIEVSPPLECPVSTIRARLVRDWEITFYIRADLKGCFYTYPPVGGPFHNLEEADNAIDRHLDDHRAPKRYMKQDTPLERVIWEALHWPDGSIRKRTKSHVMEKTQNGMCRLVQALVDKYNVDENILGDLAYELKNVLHYQSIYENHRWYYHLNFTAKTKGADDSETDVGNLFFAEVKRMQQGKREEFLVSCICKLNPLENGQHCYGCTNNGTVDMKHPDSSAEYTAGHLDAHLSSGCFGEWSDSEDDDTYMKAKEEKVRRMYQGLDDPRVKEKLFTLPPEAGVED